jgi:hypothetical protein
MDKKRHKELVEEINGCREALRNSFLGNNLNEYTVNAIERLIIAHITLVRETYQSNSQEEFTEKKL